MFNVLGRTEEAISNFKSNIYKKITLVIYTTGQLLKKQNLFNDAIDFLEALMQVKQKTQLMLIFLKCTIYKKYENQKVCEGRTKT